MRVKSMGNDSCQYNFETKVKQIIFFSKIKMEGESTVFRIVELFLSPIDYWNEIQYMLVD